ncbi:hypothetical protein SHI21_17560 [Bacteriovorax sp. PP10]|uniref:Lipoprotein n=1 Tax=Bacteriovorax antarcticus TaxID=3088717 RepID=A0ABU5VY90_9BACT|nr:hypothetical protein [Bacteriovorax sp. PP10]MEA9358044.1 hypothetical protein [Bacteriovorax sp. PP10]
MKTLPLIILVLILTACSKNESGPAASSLAVEQNEQKTENNAGILNAELELKKQATLLVQGIGSDENLLQSFNQYLSSATLKSYTQANASNLRAELFAIFNGRISMYLNMLNASLEGKRSTIVLEIDDNDPSSALNALQTLYNSLGTRKNRTQLSLAEQYLIFDITIYLKKKFATQNQEMIPTATIVKFLKEQIQANKENPQDAFFAYQVANEILDSSDGLYTVFYQILSQIKINENSNLNEVELFKKLSMYALEKNLTDFIQDKEDISNYFGNISFIASNKIEKLQKLGFDQRLGYFETLDYAFKAFNGYLGKVASDYSLSIQETAAIQDKFITTTYFDLINSLNNNTDTYTRLFQESCLNFKSKELDLIIKTYTLRVDRTQKIPCISFLKDKISNKKFDYITTLNSLMDAEVNELHIVKREDLKQYFSLYNKYVLTNLILNIVSEHGFQDQNDDQASKNKRHEYVYNMYEASKNNLKDLLVLREITEVSDLNSLTPTTKDSRKIIYLPAGIYTGNLHTDSELILHPLVVISSTEKELQLEVNSISGGRIDSNYNFINSLLVLNKELNQNVSRGSNPIQQGRTQVLTGYKTVRVRCREGGGGKTGNDGNHECAAPESIPVYTVSRRVTPAIAPSQAYPGLTGPGAASIKLVIRSRTIIETPVFSMGLKGYRGNQGINAPTCNSSNEYQVYSGIDYAVSCDGDRCPAVANQYDSILSKFHSYAGISGNGGQGGPGGNITIIGKSDSSYPALSLGGPGGVPGESALCTYPGQPNLIGSNGSLGLNGSVEIIK